MNTYNDAIENKKDAHLKTTDNSQNSIFIPFDFYRHGIKYGLIGGIGMALFLFALALGNVEESIGLKFFKFLILGGVLAYGLNTQKKFLGERYQFKKGILFGLFITAVSALILVLSNLVSFMFFDSLSFEKFSMEAGNIGEFMIISGIVFFETLVYGMILTFIILQYLKTSKRPV